ncbi:MAG: recombinase family protein [Acidobacteriaceae bacterium]
MSTGTKRVFRCAIYTRKSSEEGLEQSFNSLDAQREACEAYILSQRQEGWQVIGTPYDDGGYSGGSMERPGLKQLLADIDARKIDVVVVYKVDRLTRSLADFAKIVQVFDSDNVSFVSVTQQFNTTSSMGRLTLNVLLSFAQFEREVTGERIRDKIAASKRKGMWMGGRVPLGYDLKDRKLIVHPAEAKQVQEIFRAYLEVGCVRKLKAHLDQGRVLSKVRISASGHRAGGGSHSRGALYKLLANRIYIGEISHKEMVYPGEHKAIIDRELWESVRAKLAENHRARRHRTNASEPSLLSGLIFDQYGSLYTPSHAVKNGKRYRYYVSRRIIHGRSPAAAPSRIPARELEQLVLIQLGNFFGSADRVTAVLGQAGEDLVTTRALVDAAQQFAKALAGDSTSGLRELLAGIEARITIQQDSIEVHVSKAGARARLLNHERILGQDSVGPPIVLTFEMKLKRCGGEMRLIIPGCVAIDQRRRPVPSLIKAVSRASHWVRRMEAGECKHQQDLAKATKLDPRYVNSILRLAFLAPEIVETILDGRQPPDLTLGSLTGVLPVSWYQQKNLISFS